MTDVLSAGAAPDHRRLLQLPASGPRTVNELAGRFTVTRSALPQQLVDVPTDARHSNGRSPSPVGRWGDPPDRP